MTQEVLVPQQDSRDDSARLALRMGLMANVMLAIAKTAVGIVGHSAALLADGINSTSDVVYYIVVAVFMRLAAQPADDDHPYGHRQLESIAALIVGAFVMTTAVAIFWDAISSIYTYFAGEGERAAAAPIALVVALMTIMAKLSLTFFTRRVGTVTGNAAIIALAYDHRNDVFSATGAAIGITLALFGYRWVDPLAGALVAIVVFRTGVMIVRESSSDLMDTVPGAALANKARLALTGVEGVRGVSEIQAHRFGSYLVMNVTVLVDGGISVAEADLVAGRVERALASSISMLRRVHVQYRQDTRREH